MPCSRAATRLLRISAICLSVFASVQAAVPVFAEVVTFEGSAFPEMENASWQYTPQGEPLRWIADGWLFQDVDVCCGGPPGGDMDRYVLPLADWIGEETFFVEWRMLSDGNSTELVATGPASVVVGGFSITGYGFVISRDLVRFDRDFHFVEVIYVPIEENVAHTYRLELRGSEEYSVWIDGEIITSGRPSGAFPDNPENVLAWRARAWFEDSSSQWDYVRVGTISQTPGDFDDNKQIDAYDHYFFHECLTTPSGSWAGCAWADMDQDGDADCDDWALFLAAWNSPDDPPMIAECMCNLADLNGSSAVEAGDLAMLLGAWGSNSGNPADLNVDGLINASDLAQLLGAWGPCE